MLKLKRAYEPASSADGRRILVDRLWPRGLSKRRLAIDEWMKEIAPSTPLRRWFGHDAKKWPEFQRRYKRELRERGDLLRKIAALASRRRVTLVFGARDEVHNDAVVLAAVLRARMNRASGTRAARRHRPHAARRRPSSAA
ncbi:MAG TPA: DUF488 family protein [Gemmatimonadaceae bacterium]|jgi:uncharacterized protein YeaO (DUF488 family)